MVWVPSTGAGPSIQQLLADGVDMVCCSLPEAEVSYRSGDIRALGVMSHDRAVGYEDVATFQEQGRDWGGTSASPASGGNRTQSKVFRDKGESSKF